MSLLRHALRPARPAGLIFVATFTLLLLLGEQAGPFGLPLQVILLTWLFKYAYVLLDLSAEGIEDPPVLSAEMINPFEQRPFMQFLICAGAYSLVTGIGGAIGYAVGALLLLLLPATAAVLGVTGSALEAVNPVTLVRVVRGLGRAYVVLLAATFSCAAVIAALGRLAAWDALRIATSLWLLLSLFCLIGGAIHERREALGFEPQVSPERAGERAERERARRRAAMLDEAYVPARLHEPQRVIEPLRRWLDEAGGESLESDARAFLARSVEWDDAHACALVAQLVIGRLVAARRFSLALELFEAAGRAVPGETVAQARDIGALIGHARATGRVRFAERLEAQSRKP
ncbi:MAG: hypothetical protein KIT78_05565 [Steroidobacteraceae bacterium]|nr:hypothetical protein [Steroidobacteraceae bacterium]